MHDPAWDLHRLRRRQGSFDLGEQAEKARACEAVSAIVDLQRSYAGGKIDKPGELRLLDRLHQEMDTQAERDVELHWPIFDQQVVVALPAIDHGDRPRRRSVRQSGSRRRRRCA